MSHLIDTTEMFLKVVYETNEAGLPAMRARIARRLEQALPSVSQTVNRLAREGLLTLDADNRVLLTELGAEQATAVMRKHRLAERLLFEVLGFDWADCHDEACRWEHVISDAAERRIASTLSRLDTDPYGNPIPGLRAIGVDATSAARPRLRISGLLPAGEDEITVRLAAIGEPAQARHGLLADFVRCGISLDAELQLQPLADGAVLHGPTGSVTLDTELVDHVFVHAA